MWVVLYMRPSLVSRLLRLADASVERHPETPTGLVLVLSSSCSVLPHLSSDPSVPSILPYPRRLITGTERQIYDSGPDTGRGPVAWHHRRRRAPIA